MYCCDDELIYLYRQGNEWAFEELERKYLGIIRKNVYSFSKGLWYMGFETEECIQECLMCFYQCLDYYCEIKNALFMPYFNRRMNYTMVNYRRRVFKKFSNENALEQMSDEAKERLHNNHQSFSTDPIKMTLFDEELDLLEQLLQVSKGLERVVILCLLNGETSREMGKHLPIEQRKINNALYRIRKKIRFVHQKID